MSIQWTARRLVRTGSLAPRGVPLCNGLVHPKGAEQPSNEWFVLHIRGANPAVHVAARVDAGRGPAPAESREHWANPKDQSSRHHLAPRLVKLASLYHRNVPVALKKNKTVLAVIIAREQNVHMQVFAQRIRERARELGLSDAEVARRAGLSERRYGYYATGEREPNLATLVRICEVLAATPNDLLLAEGKPPAQSQRDRVLARISVATDHLSVAELELAACQIECLTAHGPGRRRRVRGRAATG